MNDVEGLVIYKQYLDLIYYTENILLKYPKSERFALANEIKNATYQGMRTIIVAQKTYNKQKRLEILNNLDVELKMIKVMVRISHKKKYISNGNYAAWSKKITDNANLLGGWINSCLKQ